MQQSNLMKRVAELSLENSINDYKFGGPFGALITSPDGKIISEAKIVFCQIVIQLLMQK